MSSTTETHDRGQVLVIFALSLLTIVLIAALAFDVGQMVLQRRDQQNAADAAALAGARYLADDPTDADGEALNAAVAIATANGFSHGVDGATVVVNVPPLEGAFAGVDGMIEVEIRTLKSPIFAGIAGFTGWDIGGRGVAANQAGIAAPFSMLALDPSGCEALQVSGNGTVTANGNIQVNSTCVANALKRTGGGAITVTALNAACNVVGGVQSSGAGSLNCTVVSPAPAIPDPLGGLAEPPIPALPLTPVLVNPVDPTILVPDGCPGGVAAATEAAPAVCQFASSHAGETWRLYPGYYPGGIQLQAGVFYFEPGIYYLGGGGLTINGNGTTSISVAAGGTTLGGGVLFFNTGNPSFATECANGTSTDPGLQCIQQIMLNGADANIDLYPLDSGTIWDGLVIFQDRDLNIAGDDVVINGSSSDTQVRGTIYVPAGDVRVNGSGGTVTTDQVIAFRFTINGAPGSVINVLYDDDFTFELSAVGLVE